MLILASQSERRVQLLQQLNLQFVQIVSPVDEDIITESNPTKMCLMKAYIKGEAVYLENKDSIVLGCDTVVIQSEQLFEKPKSKQESIQFLKKFSNNVNTVYSACCVFIPNSLYKPQIEQLKHGDETVIFEIENKQSYKVVKFLNKCDVYFRELSSNEIEEYASTTEPYDKAGGYAVQDGAAKFVQKIQGDYYSVIGLPLCKLYEVLQKSNYQISQVKNQFDLIKTKYQELSNDLQRGVIELQNTLMQKSTTEHTVMRNSKQNKKQQIEILEQQFKKLELTMKLLKQEEQLEQLNIDELK